MDATMDAPKDHPTMRLVDDVPPLYMGDVVTLKGMDRVGLLCNDPATGAAVVCFGRADGAVTTITTRTPHVRRFVCPSIPRPERCFHNMMLLEGVLAHLRATQPNVGLETPKTFLPALLTTLTGIRNGTVRCEPTGQYIYVRQMMERSALVRADMLRVVPDDHDADLRRALSAAPEPTDGTVLATLRQMFMQPLTDSLSSLTPMQLAPALHNLSFLPREVCVARTLATLLSFNTAFEAVADGLVDVLGPAFDFVEFGCGTGAMLLAVHCAKARADPTIDTGLYRTCGVDMEPGSTATLPCVREYVQQHADMHMDVLPTGAEAVQHVADKLAFRAGTRVRFNGLQAVPELNGQQGVVVKRLLARQRFKVRLPGTDRVVAVRLANLRRPTTVLYASWLDNYAPVGVGDVVRLHQHPGRHGRIAKLERHGSALLKTWYVDGGGGGGGNALPKMRPAGYLRVPDIQNACVRAVPLPHHETCMALLTAVSEAVPPEQMAVFDDLLLVVSGERVAADYPAALSTSTTGEGAPHSRVLLAALQPRRDLCFRHPPPRVPTFVDNTAAFQLAGLHAALARPPETASRNAAIAADARAMTFAAHAEGQRVLRARTGHLRGATPEDWAAAEAAVDICLRQHVARSDVPVMTPALANFVPTIVDALRKQAASEPDPNVLWFGKKKYASTIDDGSDGSDDDVAGGVAGATAATGYTQRKLAKMLEDRVGGGGGGGGGGAAAKSQYPGLDPAEIVSYCDRFCRRVWQATAAELKEVE
jgi:hypothetical protein